MPTADQCKALMDDVWTQINCIKSKLVGWKAMSVLVGIIIAVISAVGGYSYLCATDTENRVREVEQAHSATAVKVDSLTGEFRDFRTEQRIMNRDLMTAVKKIDDKIDAKKPD